MKKELQGTELVKETQKLGVGLDGIYDKEGSLREAALQDRVRKSKRSIREHRLWIVALISAIVRLLVPC